MSGNSELSEEAYFVMMDPATWRRTVTFIFLYFWLVSPGRPRAPL